MRAFDDDICIDPDEELTRLIDDTVDVGFFKFANSEGVAEYLYKLIPMQYI